MSIAPYKLLAFFLAKKLLKSTPTLTWDELQAWVAEMSRSDSFGRRYPNSHFQPQRPEGSVEVRREKLQGDRFRVSAALIIGIRNQTVASKHWDVEKIDAKLAKRFGDNLRFTLKV